VFECPLSHPNLAYLWETASTDGTGSTVVQARMLPNTAVLTAASSAVQMLLLDLDLPGGTTRGSFPAPTVATARSSPPAVLTDVVCAPPTGLPSRPALPSLRVSIDIARGKVAALMDGRQLLASRVSFAAAVRPVPAARAPDPVPEPAAGSAAAVGSLLRRAKAAMSHGSLLLSNRAKAAMSRGPILLSNRDADPAGLVSSTSSEAAAAIRPPPFAVVAPSSDSGGGRHQGGRPADDVVLLESLLQLAVGCLVQRAGAAGRGGFESPSSSPTELHGIMTSAIKTNPGRLYLSGLKAAALTRHAEDGVAVSRAASEAGGSISPSVALGPVSGGGEGAEDVASLPGRWDLGAMSALEGGALVGPHYATPMALRLEGVVLGTVSAASLGRSPVSPGRIRGSPTGDPTFGFQQVTHFLLAAAFWLPFRYLFVTFS
jgi:hypothetical protein